MSLRGHLRHVSFIPASPDGAVDALHARECHETAVKDAAAARQSGFKEVYRQGFEQGSAAALQQFRSCSEKTAQLRKEIELWIHALVRKKIGELFKHKTAQQLLLDDLLLPIIEKHTQHSLICITVAPGKKRYMKRRLKSMGLCAGCESDKALAPSKFIFSLTTGEIEVDGKIYAERVLESLQCTDFQW